MCMLIIDVVCRRFKINRVEGVANNAANMGKTYLIRCDLKRSTPGVVEVKLPQRFSVVSAGGME